MQSHCTRVSDLTVQLMELEQCLSTQIYCLPQNNLDLPNTQEYKTVVYKYRVAQKVCDRVFYRAIHSRQCNEYHVVVVLSLTSMCTRVTVHWQSDPVLVSGKISSAKGSSELGTIFLNMSSMQLQLTLSRIVWMLIGRPPDVDNKGSAYWSP